MGEPEAEGSKADGFHRVTACALRNLRLSEAKLMVSTE